MAGGQLDPDHWRADWPAGPECTDTALRTPDGVTRAVDGPPGKETVR